MIFYNLPDVRHAAVGYLQSVSIEQLVVCIVLRKMFIYLNHWKVLKPIGEKEQEKEMSRGSIPHFHKM